MNKQVMLVGGGCFWCTEAVFSSLKGVTDVTPGYAGGKADDANYEAVCSGNTGHAEAIRIHYDADIISHATLLDIFFHAAHDPTQLDKQGNDIGHQYRSVIFYHNTAEKAAVDDAITQLNESGELRFPIATTLEPFTGFYPAEEYHHQYASQHPMQPYIFCVAKPKTDKLKKRYPQLLA